MTKRSPKQRVMSVVPMMRAQVTDCGVEHGRMLAPSQVMVVPPVREVTVLSGHPTKWISTICTYDEDALCKKYKID